MINSYLLCILSCSAANILSSFFTASVSLSAGPTPEPTFYYVSPVGNDSNPGTKSQPFRTLEKARNVVRTAKKSMTHDIIIYLRGGEYRLTSPLLLEREDSGVNGHNIIYKAHPGETPHINGSQAITGWEPVEQGVYRALVGPLRFRQLYVNGVRATRARTPNVGTYYRLRFWDTSGRTVVVNKDEVGDWRRLNGAELVVQKHWNQNILRIAGFSDFSYCRGLTSGFAGLRTLPAAQWSQSVRLLGSCAKELLTFWEARSVAVIPAEPERTRSFDQQMPQRTEGQAYHFENAYEFIDAPGEWYLDTEAGKLFYKPRVGEDLASASVVVPGLETLVRIQGTLAAPVHHLVFDGLTFEYTTWLLPDHEGFIGDQAGVSFTEFQLSDESILYKGGRMPAGIYLEAAHQIRFERNTFRHMGGSAVVLHSAAQQISLTGNLIEDISGNGIAVDMNLEGNPSDPRIILKRIDILNNSVSRVGRDYYGSVGIHVGYVQEATIEHNEVSDMPYTGISVGWGWTLKGTALKDNIIRQNHVHHVMNLLDDGGGIYTLSKQPGTYISENYIHDIKRSPWAGAYPVAGIYLDEGSDLITVQNNVLQNVEQNIYLNSVSKPPVGSQNRFMNNEGFSQSIMSSAGLKSGSTFCCAPAF